MNRPLDQPVDLAAPAILKGNGDSESWRSMVRDWSLSLAFLLLYVSVFLLWKFLPSRVMFVAGAGVCALLMSVVYLVAMRRSYFMNWADAIAHALVILDVVLEGMAWEYVILLNGQVLERTQTADFHDNWNFLGCTLGFVLIIGGHRWMLLRNSWRGDRENSCVRSIGTLSF